MQALRGDKFVHISENMRVEGQKLRLFSEVLSLWKTPYQKITKATEIYDSSVQKPLKYELLFNNRHV